MSQNKIVVISPFYNPNDFLAKSIKSVLTQNYDNFDYVMVDDCSNEKTKEIIRSFFDLEFIDEKIGVTGKVFRKYKCLSKHETKARNIFLLERNERVGAMANWIDSTVEYCNKEDILSSLDGDDWFYKKDVLSFYNNLFNQENCWISYGGTIWTDGRRCCSISYTEQDFINLRKVRQFKVSQMRVYRAGLFQKIIELDEDLSCFKNNEGEFYESACDVALMYPMLEMAGKDKIYHNAKKINYVYNRSNPISDDRINQQLQWDNHAHILTKNSWNKIESYK
jgi:glycosyltransferase involved in cell wall biosynthesis